MVNKKIMKKKLFALNFSLSFLLLIININPINTDGNHADANLFDIFRDGSLYFSWKIDSSSKKIEFHINANTTGWVGIGLSPEGKMANADMILCYMKSSVPNCTDRYASGNRVPELDTFLNENSRDDLENISGEIKDGRSIFHFTRKLITGDDLDYQIQQGKEINVIFSYRKDGNPDSENGIFNMNTKYGGEKFILYPNEGQNVKNDDFKNDNRTYKMSLKFNNYLLPVNDTVYSCMNYDITKMAAETTKLPYGTIYHAVAYEPIVDNSEFMHHIVMFSCDSNIQIQPEPYKCRALPRECTKIQFEWAPGSGIYQLPNEVGILWGVSENRNIILQYHYDNPKKKSGAIDSTFVNVYFTTKLRQYDAATTSLGYPTPFIKIPSNNKAYTIGDTCSEPCTKFMKGDINVFSVFLHGHNYLRKIRTEIIYANGTIDNTTMIENNYRFDHQKYIYFKNPIKITPKDKLLTYCTYDTSNSTDEVLGGDSSSEEMCFNFMSYYPRENGLTQCYGSLPIIIGCGAYNKFDRNSTISEIEISSNFLSTNFSQYIIIIYLIMLYIY